MKKWIHLVTNEKNNDLLVFGYINRDNAKRMDKDKLIDAIFILSLIGWAMNFLTWRYVTYTIDTTYQKKLKK